MPGFSFFTSLDDLFLQALAHASCSSPQTTAVSFPLERRALNLLQSPSWCMDQYLNQSSEVFRLMKPDPTHSVGSVESAN